jgi:hypothetical protein
MSVLSWRQPWRHAGSYALDAATGGAGGAGAVAEVVTTRLTRRVVVVVDGIVVVVVEVEVVVVGATRTGGMAAVGVRATAALTVCARTGEAVWCVAAIVPSDNTPAIASATDRITGLGFTTLPFGRTERGA